MAMSKPEIQSVSIPAEAPPSNTFQVTATIQQGGPDPWASEDACTTKKLDVSGWQTPVALFIDGEKVAEREVCLNVGETRTVSLSTSLSAEGGHTATVKVYSTGGNAYDLETTPDNVADDVSGQIVVSKTARDPSKAGLGTMFGNLLKPLTKQLGASSTQVAVGMGLAIALFLFVG